MPTRTKSQAAMDAIALLKHDHETVKDLLEDLEKAAMKDGRKQTELLQEIESELKVHTQIEEEIFYPAFKAAVSKKDDAKLYFEAVEEHRVVDMVLPEIREVEPGSPEFAARVKVLQDLVEHHIEEEEGEMFPRARKVMEREELVDLGGQMAQRKSELSDSD
jgi:hemerythrin-like domain-containing protein